jgi:hypothetical protein
VYNLVVFEIDNKATVIPAAYRRVAYRSSFTPRSSPAFFDSRLRKSAARSVRAGIGLNAFDHQFVACSGSGNEETRKNCGRNSFSEHGIGTLHGARCRKYSISYRAEVWLASRSRSLDSPIRMFAALSIMTNKPGDRCSAAVLPQRRPVVRPRDEAMPAQACVAIP